LRSLATFPFADHFAADLHLFDSSDRLISFPRYRGSNSSPAYSPDGSQIAFMSSQNGDPEIYVTDAGGGNLHRITFAAGVNTSPRGIRRPESRLLSSAIAAAIRFSILRIQTARASKNSTSRTWVTAWIRRGHQMDNCWLSAGDAPAAISTSMLWMSSASS